MQGWERIESCAKDDQPQVQRKGVAKPGREGHHVFGSEDIPQYMEKVQPAKVETDAGQCLQGEQLSADRRLAMQLRGPAHW